MNAIRQIMSEAADAEIEAAWADTELWEAEGNLPANSMVRTLLERCDILGATIGRYSSILQSEIWREAAVRARRSPVGFVVHAVMYAEHDHASYEVESLHTTETGASKRMAERLADPIAAFSGGEFRVESKTVET